jgi:hypothetical protein
MTRIFALLVISTSLVCAQTKMFINKTSGTDSVLLSDVKSITFKSYTNATGTIYSEDFTANPNYWVHPDVASNDTVRWDSRGYFRIKINEDGSGNGKQKYACGPIFSEVNNASFSLKVDLKNALESWGHEAHFWLYKSQQSTAFSDSGKTIAMAIWRDDVNHYWVIQDSASHRWYLPADGGNGHWYRFQVDYTSSLKKVSITATDLQTSSIVFSVTNQECVVGPFNRVILGEHTAFWDGTICETDYDNILITSR